MNTEKIFNTDVNELTKSMSELEKTAIIQDIINLVRNNPNHMDLGNKVERYVKKVIGTL